MLYFDHNATAPLSEVAREAWLRATQEFVGNPSSPHRLGTRAEVALETARAKLAERLGCDRGQVVFTSGATESNNAVLHHAAQHRSGEVWLSAIEHPSVMQAARRFFGQRCRLIPVEARGVIAIDWLVSRLRGERPALIAVMAANNETGVLQPWPEVAALCREADVDFFCDAAQWVGKLPVIGLGRCEFASGCAHKFGGPQGIGFLKGPVSWKPLLLGGDQEHGRRAGTQNLPGVLAMVAALEEREAALASGAVQERLGWREEFEAGLKQRVPETMIVGAGEERLWNTASAVLPEFDCRQRWVVKMDKLGFAVSTGSACASGKEAPSHVLSAMGLSTYRAGRVLRFSSGWETPRSAWGALLEGIVRAAGELKHGKNSTRPVASQA